MGTGSCEDLVTPMEREGTFPHRAIARQAVNAACDLQICGNELRHERATTGLLMTDHVILTRYLISQDAISGTKTHRQEA